MEPSQRTSVSSAGSRRPRAPRPLHPPALGWTQGQELPGLGVPNPLQGMGSIRTHSPVPCPGLFRCLSAVPIGAGSWRGAWRGVAAPRGQPRPSKPQPFLVQLGAELCGVLGLWGLGDLGIWGFGALGWPSSCSCSRRGRGLSGQHPLWLGAELAVTPSPASGGSPLPGPSERALLFSFSSLPEKTKPKNKGKKRQKKQKTEPDAGT